MLKTITVDGEFTTGSSITNKIKATSHSSDDDYGVETSGGALTGKDTEVGRDTTGRVRVDEGTDRVMRGMEGAAFNPGKRLLDGTGTGSKEVEAVPVVAGAATAGRRVLLGTSDDE